MNAFFFFFMLFLQRCLVLGLALSFISSFVPQTVWAGPSLRSASDEISVDTDGFGAFAEDGSFYLAGSRAIEETSFETVFRYDTAEHETLEAPFILGDIDLAVSDTAGGFYLFGEFNAFQQPDSADDQSITEVDQEKTLIHIDEDGIAGDPIEIDTDGFVETIAYVEAYNAVFLGGDFTEVNGEIHQSLACIDVDTGDACVIGAQDWADVTGFDGATTVYSIDYDAINDRLLIGSTSSTYAGGPESAFTVLDPQDPSENFAAAYLGLAEEELPVDQIDQVVHFDTGEDLDANEIDEQLLYLFAEPIIDAYYDNGAGFFSNTQINTLGFETPLLVEQPSTPPRLHLAATAEFAPGMPTVSRSEIVFDHDGDFEFTLSVDDVTYPIIERGDNNFYLEQAVVTEAGDTYFGGYIEYAVDDEEGFYSLIGLDESSELVYSGSNLEHDVDTVALSGDVLFSGGAFQIMNPTVPNRSILKIDNGGATVDEDFDPILMDEDGDTVTDVQFIAIGDNLLIAPETFDEVVSVRNFSEGTSAAVPKTNLFKIDRTTGVLDEAYETEIDEAEEIEHLLLSADEETVYALTEETIYAFDPDTGEVDEDFTTAFDESGLNIETIDQAIISDDWIYLAYNEEGDNVIDLTRVDTGTGEAELITSFTPAQEATALHLLDEEILMVAYEEGDEAYVRAFYVGEENFGDLVTNLDLERYTFVSNITDEDAHIASIQSERGNIYLSGIFDEIQNSEDESENTDYPYLVLLSEDDGDINTDKRFFSNVYTDSFDSYPQLEFDAENDEMVLYGDFSYQIDDDGINLNESLRSAPFGIVFFPTGDAPILTETDPIASRTRASQAVYGFTFVTEDEEETEALFEECGAEARLDSSDGVGSVSFGGLEIGETYACDFQYENEYGSSNVLSIGPFTVFRRSGRGGGSGMLAETDKKLMVPPQDALLINAGVTTTTSRDVTLLFDVENAASVALSETGIFGTPQPFAESLPFTLSADPGVHTVFAKLIGEEGDEKIVRDQIVLHSAGLAVPVSSTPPETPATPLACVPPTYPTQPIRFGGNNDAAQVRALETFLGVVVNGEFETSDRGALVAWQEQNATSVLAPWGLRVGTGIVGPTTLRRMKEVAEATCAVPAPATTLACLTRIETLVRGTESDEVRIAQDLLRRLNFFSATSTGSFGPLTESAVRAFQAANQIAPLGIIGPQTRAALNAAACR